ncbi:MAG: FHA domain-containing protein [Butyrivibrio sp.]|nr:FHA domain-containing protein [Acetatifactor muris]MCM1558514.1 FHA domain-containing protein [Butyrivibrio sp.]
MNRVICAKGHFYDGDKYEACPHCAAGVEAIRQDPFSIRHSELEEKESEKKSREKVRRIKGGLFRRGEKERQEAANIPEIPAPQQTALQQTVLLQAEQKEQKEPESRSLSAAFAAAAQPDEKEEEGKTIGYFSVGGTEPPVGYLICTAGENYGNGFPLKTGSNSIGRSASMNVVITDQKVSREKQALVVYEPFKREFYIKPGEGTGLCYLNGELVLGPVKMKEFDVILLGDTSLMLIPVCCERFSWEEAKSHASSDTGQ